MKVNNYYLSLILLFCYSCNEVQNNAIILECRFIDNVESLNYTSSKDHIEEIRIELTDVSKNDFQIESLILKFPRKLEYMNISNKESYQVLYRISTKQAFGVEKLFNGRIECKKINDVTWFVCVKFNKIEYQGIVVKNHEYDNFIKCY
jgi:hypothetical protein